MQAGKLRHVIEIQQYPVTDTADDFGASERTYTTALHRRCEITDVRGKLNWQGRQLVPEATHVIRMRFTEGLHPKHRLYEARTGRIFAILEIGLDATEVRQSLVTVREKVPVTARLAGSEGWQLDFSYSDGRYSGLAAVVVSNVSGS